MAKNDISKKPDPGRDPVARAAEAARQAAKLSHGPGAASPQTPSASTLTDAASSAAASSASSASSPASAFEQRSQGVGSTGIRSAAATSATNTARVEWEPRPFSKWWLVAPSVAALAGLTAWQVNATRHHSEEDLHTRALNTLRTQFPNASLQFRGRDAVISGVSLADQQRAHDLVRNVRGVRHVTEKAGALAAPPTTLAAPSTTLAAPPTTLAAPPTTLAAPSTTLSAVAPPDTAGTSSSEVTIATKPATTNPTPTTVPAPVTTPPAGPSLPAAPIEIVAGQDQVIGFEKASCELGTTGADSFDAMAAYLRANPDIRLAVRGHADSRGTRIGNLAISTCRAEAVRDALVSRGIPASQISARGFGSRFAIGDNATEAGRQQNRRVELRLLGGDTVSYTG